MKLKRRRDEGGGRKGPFILHPSSSILSFTVTLAGAAAGFWQAAALAGVAGGYLARERVYRSAVCGALLGWLLLLSVQLVATPAGRVVGAFGGALMGAAGLPVLVLASLLFAGLLALLGALVGRSLRRVLAGEN